MEGELGRVRRGDYICAECQEKAAEDPAELLHMMLRQAGLIERDKAKPEVPGYEIRDLIGRADAVRFTLQDAKGITEWWL